MILRRLSGVEHARAFDGGYGLLFDGRWNTMGRPVTYAATSPSLCVLEQLVQIEDPALMPALVMVCYEAPDDLAIARMALTDLPDDWTRAESVTQAAGNAWHAALETPLLQVPSAIVPVAGSPDLNLVINHRHPDAARIRIAAAEPFTLGVRLF
jgi:RES domain-containing protein